jgi:hypothetical protein
VTNPALVIGVTSHRNIPVREAEAIRQRVRDFLRATSSLAHIA